MRKTSEEWYEDCIFVILDHDGWDRANFEYSWYTEKITKEEFTKRLMSSTITIPESFKIGEDI